MKRNRMIGMKEICLHMSRSDATILAWIREMDFPAFKIGGIWEADLSDVEQWRKAMKNGKNGNQLEGKKIEKKGKKIETRV